MVKKLSYRTTISEIYKEKGFLGVLNKFLSEGLNRIEILLDKAFVFVFGAKHSQELENKQIEKLQSSNTLLRSDTDYLYYLSQQLKKSFWASKLNKKWLFRPGRTSQLIGQVSNFLSRDTEGEVLCVGCRDIREIEYFEKTYYHMKITGLDLFSNDKRIKIGDMHKMPFPDNHFDIVYSCHSLEHSYDLKISTQEMCRVAKSGAIIAIEMPIHINIIKDVSLDRWDVKNSEGILNYFKGTVDTIFLEETYEKIARVIFKLNK